MSDPLLRGIDPWDEPDEPVNDTPYCPDCMSENYRDIEGEKHKMKCLDCGRVFKI